MREVAADLRQRWRDDAPILAGLLSTWIVVLLFLARKGVQGLRWNPWEQNFTLYFASLAVIAVLAGAKKLAIDRPVSPIHHLSQFMMSRSFLLPALGGLPMLMAMIGFIPIFSAVKTTIPLVTTYSWDGSLAAADRMIFGTDAWRILQPIVGYPLVTSALSVAYHAWIFLLYGCGVYFCFFVKQRDLRAQYFIARFAMWIVLGMIMAITFASVGPCFLGPILGDHQFDAQMQYLRMANTHYPVFVLPVQDQLIEWYRAGNHDLGAGISAMPSLHVSMTALAALAVQRLSRTWGAFLWVFTVIITIGSVHLAYHYAMDSIVALVGTIALWHLSGIVARRVTARLDPHSNKSMLGPIPARTGA